MLSLSNVFKKEEQRVSNCPDLVSIRQYLKEALALYPDHVEYIDVLKKHWRDDMIIKKKMGGMWPKSYFIQQLQKE